MTDLSLNCLIMLDKTHIFSSIKIPVAGNINTLQNVIKDMYPVSLANVEATSLILWMVSLPFENVESELDNINFDAYTKLSPPWKKLSSFFDELKDEMLHVIVQLPLPSARLLLINYWIEGQDFTIVSRLSVLPTGSVSDIKRNIKDRNPISLAAIDANELKLFHVSLPLSAPTSWTIPPAQVPLLQGPLSDLFPETPNDHHLHIIARVPLHKHRKRTLSETSDDIHHLWKRTKVATIAPSQIAKPSFYENLQTQSSERILDDRPSPDEGIPPLPLLYEGFGHFLDIMDGLTDVPGLANVDIAELRNRVDDLAATLTRYFDNKEELRDAALPLIEEVLLSRRHRNISPRIGVTAIESVACEGDMNYDAMLYAYDPGSIIVKFENCHAGITSTLPQIELVGYFAHLNLPSNDECQNFSLRWGIIPCLGMTIIGCNITFYAIVAIDHRIRLVNLSPTLSCIRSASDGRDRTLLYLAFTAALVLQTHILQDGKAIMDNPSTHAISFKHCRSMPAIAKLCRYKSHGHLTFQILQLFPSAQPNCYLYSAVTTDSVKEVILIKFVRRYTIELHQFCSERGFAPALLAYERLPGGWYAVAMEYIESGLPITDAKIASQVRPHRDKWKRELKEIVHAFHNEGFVHGDLRDANILFKDNSIKLIDFDWGGREGEVHYPTKRLNEELLRGREHEDLLIRKEDDDRVLGITLEKLDKINQNYFP